jgi:protein-tyrosine phosphatase
VGQSPRSFNRLRIRKNKGNSMTAPVRVLFVCMGNICRSPTAHGVFRQLVAQAGLAEQVHVASAGTHDYHQGEPPDSRSVKHARSRGYDLSDLRARLLTSEELERADLVLVMDEVNQSTVEDLCSAEQQPKIKRLTEFCRTHSAESVPDPYGGGPKGFEKVLDLVEDACAGLLGSVRLLVHRRAS